ncbi:PKD domain-containing protein [Glutamicibacter sp. X7]
MGVETCPNDQIRQFYDDKKHERRKIKRKTKVRVDYDDSCRIGLEYFDGCDSNPDSPICIDGTRPKYRYVTVLEGPREGEVIQSGLYCPEDPEPKVSPEGNLVVEEEIVVTPAEFRKFPIKSFSVHSDPDGVSLIRAYTHFWAEGGAQEFHTVMSGKNVDVRAIPVEWLWDYGDGTTARFSDPGGPVDDRSLSEATPTSHQFQDTGLFQVKVTTMYRGEFRVENGPWEPIPGQAAVPSDQSPMDIWRTKKQLVDPNV